MRALLHSNDDESASRWTARLTGIGSEVEAVGETIGSVEAGDILVLVYSGAGNGTTRGAFDTIRHFRQQLPSWLPVMIVLGESPASPEEWLDAGADDILIDRVETADLRARLHSAVRHGEKFRAETALFKQSQASLTAGLAHDYNNLLSAIQGNVDLSLMNPLIPSELRHNLEQISLATQKAAHLTRQVLDSSRLQEGVPPALNLNESIRQLCGGSGKAVRSPVTEFKLARAVPLVHFSFAMLDTAVTLLVKTAEQSLESTQGRLEIATGVGSAGEAMLEVRVAGAPEAAPLRTDGVAVTACTVALEAAGARLSRPDQHTVRVNFPLLNAKAEDSSSAREGLEGRASGTILLVDDEDAVRTATHRLLRREGYTVLEASSGEEGMNLFRCVGGMVDAVILDLNMPGVGGGEVLRHMRRLRPEIRVVVWSGLPADVARSRVNGLKDITFVEKPIQLADFPGMLNRILRES